MFACVGQLPWSLKIQMPTVVSSVLIATRGFVEYNAKLPRPRIANFCERATVTGVEGTEPTGWQHPLLTATASYTRLRYFSTLMETPRLRALLVDDEELARENLRMMLADECPEVEVVGTADGLASARQRIGELDPDLIFLDIRMPSGTEGLDLLEVMPDARFMVVFVTAFKDYAVQAFHNNAVDYVLKPIDPDELRAAVVKALRRWDLIRGAQDEGQRYREDLHAAVKSIKQHGGAPRLAVDHAKGFKLFEPHTIMHLEADGNCTLLHFTDGSRYLDTRTLKVYEDMLDPLQFLRVHRSHLINVDQLREYLRDDGHWAVMKDGARVPIARERVQAFVEATRG